VLSLDARPVAIFGRNGAGKTNILEAVSLLSPGRGLRGASAEDMARRPESVGWKLTGVLQSLHQVHEVETWAEAGASRNVTIDDVGKSALYLLSDLGSGVTGETHHVDAGYHVVGMKAVDAPDMSKE
jgi:recombinational DNA repair ATPase RecF